MSDRATREAVARSFQAEGLSQRQIADRMGVAHQTVSAWFTDPGGKRLRARHESYKVPCRGCGTLTRAGRCPTCAGKLRRRPSDRDDRIVSLWNEGLTSTQIAAEIGLRPRSVSTIVGQLRAAGRDLKLRRPDQVAHAARMGKANRR